MDGKAETLERARRRARGGFAEEQEGEEDKSRLGKRPPVWARRCPTGGRGDGAMRRLVTRGYGRLDREVKGWWPMLIQRFA
jgi:hypothetical protein